MNPSRIRIPTTLGLAAAMATMITLGTACDVEQGPLDDRDLLAEQELDEDESELSEEALAFEAELEGTEPYVGVSSRIDALAAAPDVQAFTWLNWHSDETVGASTCSGDQVVTGFDCSGSYCDNVRLECHDYGADVISHRPWSAWFEYNGKFRHTCPSGTKITGIDCWGDNCDNISIRCSDVPGLGTARCGWTTEWYSEEDPSPFLADVGDAIQGIWCSGTHCDNKRFYVCET